MYKRKINIYLASEVLGEKDVPCSQVPVNEVFAGKVLHSVGHLTAEGEELCREGGRDGERTAGGGRRSDTRAGSTGLRGSEEKQHNHHSIYS